MFDFIGRKRIWFAASLVIIAIGMFFWITKGLNVGIDFQGGSVLDLQFNQALTTTQIRSVLDQDGFNDSSVQMVGTDGREFLMRTLHMTEDARAKVYSDFRTAYGEFTEVKFDSVSPLVGHELVMLAIWATVIANVGMLIYITLRFEYRFAVAGIIALIHDVLMTISFFAIFRWTVDSTFIAAILTVVGYSINDTIVVYDRIREKLKFRQKGETADVVANKAINETLRRSVLTSLTTVVAIAAVLFLGGVTIRPFALALVIGITSGTYSSIFIASPIWTIWRNWEEKRNIQRHEKFQATRETAKVSAAKPALAGGPSAGPVSQPKPAAKSGNKKKGKNGKNR